MPEGKEMGKAYVTVNLDDHTDADYAKLKANLEAKKDIVLGSSLGAPGAGDYEKIKKDIEGRPDLELSTKLKDPPAGDYDRIKAITEAKSDIVLKVRLDANQAQEAFTGLESSIDSSSKKSQSSIGQFLTSTAGAYTALGALLAGPAVSLGLGVIAGGFAAIGIEAEKSQPQVVSAFNTMKTTGTDVLQASFQSLTPFIAGSINTWTGAIRTLGPSFSAISAEIGPGMRIVADSIASTAQRDIPQLSGALAQATPMAHSLAVGIGDVGDGFVKFLGELNFNEADQGLSALFRDVGQLEGSVGSVVNAIMPLSNALLSQAIPAVLTLVSDLSNGLAPALRVVGSAVTALVPLFNFLSGPNDAILVAVLGYKALGGAVSAALPVFNSISDAVTKYGNKLNEVTGGSDKAIGSFNLMTDAQKKAATQAAATGLATATQASLTAQANLETLTNAAANDAASVSEAQLAAARTAATAATEAEVAATDAVNTASEATSFALGPVGIGLGVVAGLMTLFGGNTDKATPPVQNFTQQIDKLAAAAPDAAKGILASDPALADLVNRAHDAGISVQELAAALDQGGAAQKQVQDALNGTSSALGNQIVQFKSTTTAGKGAGSMVTETAISVKDLSDKIGDSASAFNTLTPAQQNLVNQYRNVQGVIGALNPMFAQNGDAAKAAASTAGKAVELTADQQTAAASVAKMYGLSVGEVSTAFQTLPGAGSSAVGAVQQVTSEFMTAENAALNSVQSTKDYFSQLQQNATQANQAASNANHSYQQSIVGVSDAEHAETQAAQGVKDAQASVVTARRAVTDATNAAQQAELSYEASQRAVEDANRGVTTAENNLTTAQQSEIAAQKALTQARVDAVEQLKSLQLQLNDQVASEQAARLKLYDQTPISQASGVTADNADAILAQTTTSSNEAQQKSALDLVNAENALADTLDTGAVLRQKVTAANQASVAGNAGVISATQALKTAQDQVTSSDLAVTKSHQAVADAVNAEGQAAYNLTKANQAIIDAQAGVVKAQQGVTDAVYNENKARGAVKDAIYSEHQALLALNDAQAAAKKANDLNTTSLDLSTQAGRNNWAQLQTIFSAIPAWVTGNDRYNQEVDDTAVAFGGSKQAAQDFLKAQGQIPKDFQYSVTAVTQVDTTALEQLYAQTNPQNFANGTRGHVAMADGGKVPGVEGDPRADDVPAMLTAGEYVQPVDVVQHYGVAHMDAMRQKKLPKGYAGGGVVDMNVYGGDVGAAYVSTVNSLTMAGLPHPQQIPEYVPPPVPVYTGSAGVSQWTPQVLQALGLLGQSPALLPNVLRRMNQESGGNPTVVNTTDSNWQRGTPSVGLMQVIGPTFRSNAGQFGGVGPFEYGVSTNPEANIYAGLHYAIGRYPSLQYAMDKPGGYDSGGYMLDKPALNSTGKPEMILPPTMTDTLNQIHAMVQGGQGGSGPKTVVHAPVTVYANEKSDASTAHAIGNEIAWKLGSR